VVVWNSSRQRPSEVNGPFIDLLTAVDDDCTRYVGIAKRNSAERIRQKQPHA